jgi:hypothetical protein
MKHSLSTVLTFLLLIGYFYVADISFVAHLKAQEPAATEETKQEEETKVERAPIYLDKVTIVLEGPEVLAQAGVHEWAGKAAKIVTEWYPKLDKLLETDGFTPAKEMTIVFRKMDGVAFASGTTITISTNWIGGAGGREDWGMVVHELVHLIQRYQGGREGAGLPAWLMEGQTDYIRHAYYEPEKAMRPVNPDSANYDNSYQITGGFIMYIVCTYDKDFNDKLTQAARTRTYSEDMFEKASGGKNIKELWAEYIEKVVRPQYQANPRVGYIPDVQFPKLKELRDDLDKRIAAAQPSTPTPQQPQQRGQGRGGQRPQPQ